MKIAHLILVHAAPDQLKRLVESLCHPDVDIYLSVDLKTDISPFMIFGKYKNVYFIKNRIKNYWGDYSLVQSTLIGFEEILSSGKNYDHVNFLSGSDYPLQRPEKFISFLKENPDTAFMEFHNVNEEWQEAISRIETYHLGYYRLKGIYAAQKVLNFLLPRRKVPYHMVAVGRSQWFTIPIACVRYIIEFMQTHPKVERYFKMVWGSDEIIFQTVLYNSPFRKMMKNENLRYIDWTGKGVSPKLLTLEDKDKLMGSGKFFARKFNMEVDAEIMDYIDIEVFKESKQML